MAPGAQASHEPASTTSRRTSLLPPPSFVEPPLLEALDAPLLVVDPEPKLLEPLLELVLVVDSEPEPLEPLLGMVLVPAPLELALVPPSKPSLEPENPPDEQDASMHTAKNPAKRTMPRSQRTTRASR